jgi:glutaredoxin 3
MKQQESMIDQREDKVMEQKIIIYGTNNCPFCIQARESYGDKAVFINVENDTERLNEMLNFPDGRRQVPVIVEGDKVTVGFAGETSLRGGIPIFGGT